MPCLDLVIGRPLLAYHGLPEQTQAAREPSANRAKTAL